MYCSSCGKKIDNHVNACPFCGHVLKEKELAYQQQKRIKEKKKQSSQRREQLRLMLSSGESRKAGLCSEYMLVVVMAVLALICAGCSININVNYATFIAAAILIYFCCKQYRYDSKFLFLPIAIYMAKELICYIFTKMIYYSYLPAYAIITGLVFFIVDILAVVFYGLYVFEKIQKNKAVLIFITVIIAVLIAGLLLTLFTHRLPFQAVMNQLAGMFFLGVYLILIARQGLAR